MTKDDYLELIKSHRNKLNCIDKLLFETEVMIQEGYPVNEIYGKFLSVVEQTEKFNLLMRELPVYTGEPRAFNDVYEIVEKTANIEIGYTEQGWFCVKMPWLLQKKEHGNNRYIRSILYPAMEKFFKNKARYKPKDAVLVYRHVYEENFPEKKMRDHDNIEINQVSDIVAFFAMKDDAPWYCEHFYMSAKDKMCRTEVYVVPQDEFEEFIKMRKNMLSGGQNCMIYGIKRLRHLCKKWGKNFCISLMDMKMIEKPNDFTLFNPDFKAGRIITCRSYYSRRDMIC